MKHKEYISRVGILAENLGPILSPCSWSIGPNDNDIGKSVDFFDIEIFIPVGRMG